MKKNPENGPSTQKSNFNWPTLLCALCSALAASFSAYIAYSNYSYLADMSRPIIDIERNDTTVTFLPAEQPNTIFYTIAFSLRNGGKEPLKILNCDWCVINVKEKSVFEGSTNALNSLSSGSKVNLGHDFFIKTKTDFSKLGKAYLENNLHEVIKTNFEKLIIAFSIKYKSNISNKVFTDKYYYADFGRGHLEYLSSDDYQENIELMPMKFRQE